MTWGSYFMNTVRGMFMVQQQRQRGPPKSTAPVMGLLGCITWFSSSWICIVLLCWWRYSGASPLSVTISPVAGKVSPQTDLCTRVNTHHSMRHVGEDRGLNQAVTWRVRDQSMLQTEAPSPSSPPPPVSKLQETWHRRVRSLALTLSCSILVHLRY